ncbi:hypothetical protein CYMTET_44683 [Cymbomonas tetramitiformis]|uniref:Uncharacterized protein n=1 Tax=Cymbomonas tetramitiformis TaxID=36881 RepID=A0AAE0C209_9CHLO|nr:hypothetical protein CYMTET_44683 [Cymbomonas tetramitiformis]
MCMIGYYVNSYDQYVRVYLHNMTSPDLPSAPFSAVRMSNMSSQVYDMVNVAHLTTSVISNATSLENKHFNDFEPDNNDHRTQKERAHQIEQRLNALNQTLGAVQRVTDTIASTHTTTLMDAMRDVLNEKVASVDMKAINQMLYIASDDRIINRTLSLVDKTMDKVEVYERTSGGVLALLTEALNAWENRKTPEQEKEKESVWGLMHV